MTARWKGRSAGTTDVSQVSTITVRGWWGRGFGSTTMKPGAATKPLLLSPMVARYAQWRTLTGNTTWYNPFPVDDRSLVVVPGQPVRTSLPMVLTTTQRWQAGRARPGVFADPDRLPVAGPDPRATAIPAPARAMATAATIANAIGMNLRIPDMLPPRTASLGHFGLNAPSMTDPSSLG